MKKQLPVVITLQKEAVFAKNKMKLLEIYILKGYFDIIYLLSICTV